MNADKGSLFERMGGDQKVESMLKTFYDRVLADPELAPFFKDSNLGHLLAMQHAFFSVALDGPIDYASRKLVATHHGRGIERKHFTRFCEHLLSTLIDSGMPVSEADQVLGRVAMYAGSVTGDASVDG